MVAALDLGAVLGIGAPALGRPRAQFARAPGPARRLRAPVRRAGAGRHDRRQEAARIDHPVRLRADARGDAPRGDRARRHRLTPRQAAGARESLTPRIPSEYKRQSRCPVRSGRTSRNWWRSSTAASRPCSWASTASRVDSFAKSGYDGALPDIQTLAMEFAHLIAQARRTLQSLDAGPLEEFTLRAEIADAGGARADARSTSWPARCCRRGSLGKARYLMRMTAPALRADL